MNAAEHTDHNDRSQTDVEAFLEMWFSVAPAGQLLEVRPLNKRPGKRPLPQSWAQSAPKALASIQDSLDHKDDVYVGTLPRRSASGKADAVGALCWLWSDIDYGTIGHAVPAPYPTSAEALAAIQQIGIDPTAIIDTGGGFHVWYALSTEPTRGDWREGITRLCHALRGDANALDLPRILRVPGTLNFKSDPPRPARIVTIDAAVRHPIGTFLELPPVPEVSEEDGVVFVGGDMRPRSEPRGDRPFDRANDIPVAQILEWLGVKMHREGARIYCACPVHHGHNKSQMVVGGSENTACCFGDCDRTFSAVDLVAYSERIPPKEAVNRIAKRFNFDGFPDRPVLAAVRPAVPSASGAPAARAPANDSTTLDAAVEVDELRDSSPPDDGGAGEDPPLDRPEIRIGHRVDIMADAATYALRYDAGTFQRGGALVHIARVDADDARLPIGTPTIRTMARPTLRARLARHAEWLRLKVTKSHGSTSEEWTSARPDEAAVAAVHEQGEWPGVRVLVGVTETPIVRPDGSIGQQAGFDRATGYVYLPGATFPPIPDHPTRAHAAEALAALASIFKDFPYASEAQRHVPIAAILTILARPAIRGAVPAIEFDASAKGSGKTLQSDVIAAITTGRAAPRTNYPAEDEELRKVLDGHAMQGTRVVALDNVARPLGGAALDAYLTARDTVDVRVLGKTGQITMPWRACLMFGGNNIEHTGDTMRRVLVARIEPPPHDRVFETDLVVDVLGDRARFVSAALTIIRAFTAAGRPDQRIGSWASYEEWSKLIAQAIVYAGGPNVLDARPAKDGEGDRDAQALASVIEAIGRLDPRQQGVTVKDLIHRLYPADDRGQPRLPHADAAPDGFSDAREALEFLAPPRGTSGIPSAHTLGNRLRAFRGRWVRVGDSNRRLVAGKRESHGTVKWLVESALGGGTGGTRGTFLPPTREEIKNIGSTGGQQSPQSIESPPDPENDGRDPDPEGGWLQ